MEDEFHLANPRSWLWERMLAQLNDFNSKGLHFKYAGNGPR